MCPYAVLGMMLLILYGLFDVHYYIRALSSIVWARFFSKKKKSIFATTTSYSFTTTNDMDILIQHMNNARYLREMDFVRFSHNELIRLYPVATSVKGGSLVLSGVAIRFRKSISIFSLYKIESRIVYWEDKSIYYEQKFITVNDGFVRGVAYVKQSIIGWNSAQELINAITISLTNGERETEAPPQLTEDIRLWMASIKESSNMMKKKD